MKNSRITYFWEVLKYTNKAMKLKAERVLLFAKQLRAATFLPEAGDLFKPQGWHRDTLSDTGLPR